MNKNSALKKTLRLKKNTVLKKSGLIAVLVVAAVVLVAGCGPSTGGTAAPAPTSASVGSPVPGSTSSMAGAGTAGSGAQSSMGSSSESTGASAEESTTGDSTTESSTESSMEESTTTSTSAASALDPASTKWLTTYCTSFGPILGLTTLQTQITAAKGNLVKIRVLLVHAFQVSGAALTGISTKLKGVSAPTLTKAGSNLAGLLGKAAALGATLTADGKKIAATNPAKDPEAFASAYQKYAPDLNRVSTELGATAGLKIPFTALTDIKKIDSCDKVITFA